MMLRTISFGLILAISFSVLQACSPASESTGDEKILATINDYHLSLDAFSRQLASELELEKNYKLTEDAKREFLETLIDKELLIQEAVRMKLDRRDAFTKAIEKYWESTLIRDLITLKSQEISETIYVSQEEVVERYGALKQSAPTMGPLTEELKEQLLQELKASKKSNRLKTWIDELRKQATIEIDDALLASH